MKLNTREMTIIAVMAALICVAGPLTIAIGPIPLSLATFTVYLAGAVLGAKRGTLAVALYLLIGAVGVPVFSGFSGGVQKLVGVTGGYLVGYLPCAWLTGLGAGDDGTRLNWRLPAMMVAGTAVLYAIGTAWFMAQTKNPLGAALGMCVLPFLPGDAVKIIAATLLSRPIRKAVYR
ncbi:MAG: biotin transporter BioY [Clostridia bacterium]|nr:biotin transporter BioY [Clostridia bacterium]